MVFSEEDLRHLWRISL